MKYLSGLDNLFLNQETPTQHMHVGGLGRDFQKRLLDVFPARLIAKPLTNALAANANVNVSNVRGPNRPLYMAGARLERFIPYSLVTEGCGLNITGFSYTGIMRVAVTCCREMLPDPAYFNQCLNDSFKQLKVAAQKKAGSAAAKPRRRAAKTTARRSKARAKTAVPKRKRTLV